MQPEIFNPCINLNYTQPTELGYYVVVWMIGCQILKTRMHWADRFGSVAGGGPFKPPRSKRREPDNEHKH